MVGNNSLLKINNKMAAIELQNTLPTIQMSVGEFYNGKTVFITGGTGFMGKVLLEKLLRSCHGVVKIYLLIRPKKGQNAHERLQQLLWSPVSTTFTYFCFALLCLTREISRTWIIFIENENLYSTKNQVGDSFSLV